MSKPPTPVDESRRLETLRSLRLLDTAPEERFDRVTRLARKVFGTPIALVSLVDADRQWFKSCQGLDVTETSRDVSFCAHAILNDRMLIVKDTRKDERFCDNPLVTCDPNIRFYAGYPLSAPDGSKVGTLCIIDREPRDVDQEDLGLLQELGRMVEEDLIAADLLRTDPVTSLSTRVGFSQIAEHLLAMCARTDSPTSLILFHFTNLRDICAAQGHAEGDRTAVELAHLLMASFRHSDIVGRVGFDLFAVLLAGSDLNGIDAARQRLADRLGDHNRDDDCATEIELESYAIAHNAHRHPTVEAMLQDAESRVSDSRDIAEATGSPPSIQTGTA